MNDTEAVNASEAGVQAFSAADTQIRIDSHILIVEDSRTQAELLKRLLARNGYPSRIAGDGRHAMDEIRSNKPAMILSDVEMPAMDGYEMCRAIKEDPRLRDVPVALLTSLSDPADVLRGLESGADYYLTKPYDDAHLLSTVESALATAKAPDMPEENAAEPITFAGRSFSVTAGRRQVLTLLLSTYGSAVQQNRQLTKTQRELRLANHELAEQARKLREGEERLREQNRLLAESICSERAARDTLMKAQSHMVQSEKLASLGQMVAGVAHEINNPLAFVSNNVVVLQRDMGALRHLLELYQEAEVALVLKPELLTRIHHFCDQFDMAYTLPNLQDVLASCRDGLKRIQQIVKDLREFARLDESDLSDVDLNAGLNSTANIIRNRAVEKGIELVLELSPMAPVSCYPAKINQVVLNLISNAIDASSAGQRVVVRAIDADSEAIIEVADSGHGIDSTIRERIFDPFFTTKPLGKGTGLGLSISYGIVQEHGGHIEVQSKLGVGTRFVVHLPRKRAIQATSNGSIQHA